MATKTKKTTGKSVKFRICKGGYSPEYRHAFGGKDVSFVGGRFQTGDAKLIDHLKGCRWCEVYK